MRSILSGAAEGKHRYIAGYLIEHEACIDPQFELQMLYAFFIMAGNDATALRHEGKFGKERWIGTCQQLIRKRRFFKDIKVCDRWPIAWLTAEFGFENLKDLEDSGFYFGQEYKNHDDFVKGN